MEKAPGTLALEVSVVILRVAEMTCAIPSAHVIETMRRLPVTPLDGMPSFAAGVAMIRGESVPVLDLGAVLGRTIAGSRMVTLRANRRTIALLVDDVIGVARLDATELAGRPPVLTESPSPIVHALARREQTLHLVLSAARLVDQAVPLT